MFDIQSYQKAESVSDAIRLLGEDPEARLIAGGTDVLIKLREFEGFSRLVDIHPLRAAIFNLKTAALFYAYGQKGATTHDEAEGENPRGIDRRD